MKQRQPMVSITYRELLNQELKSRIQNDPLYSLRAMARQIKISPAMLSAILNGKRNLSVEKACDISKALLFTERQSDYFVLLVLYANVSLPKSKEDLRKKLLLLEMNDDVLNASERKARR
ncbi:helix-turn-helix domain-containing protein [Bdellovibrio sp. HCB274]|uniref:helix-turn-helix domain-containing protein n=1 Tax=Bdellovibrio sp. HCB274 TaxID=3394361 RepID=UPI0039B49052